MSDYTLEQRQFLNTPSEGTAQERRAREQQVIAAQRKPTYSYDEQCAELARYFVAESKYRNDENVASLAQHIQDTIEDWFLRYDQDHEEEL